MKILSLFPAVAISLALAGCSHTPSVEHFGGRCSALAGKSISTSSIGLPSGPATVLSAVLVTAAPESVTGNTLTPAIPEYCKVLGSVAPRDPKAQPINFQLNLPTRWNGKALQYGGGGFNGVLVSGLAPLRDAAPGDPLPITRGYATFGTDSGHQASTSPASEPGAFALNDEMLENFAYASYKKVRDVAVDLMRGVYGQAPRQLYYFGGSEGGREGLTMAQRFPADYDGIVSVVPVINWTGLFHAFVRNEVPQFGDWLDAAKTPLIAKATSDACDALDGLADGVVNNYLACQGRVNLQPLRCPGGTDAGAHCLSDAELSLMRGIHSPYTFSFPLANGITTYPQWLYGHEDSPDGAAAMNLVRWVSGSAAPTVPPNASTAATQWLYGSNWVRYAITRDANFDVRSYRPESFATRVQQTSALIDSTNPDLSAFFARGGKLIIRENAADRAQSPLMGIEYYKAMVARLGQAAVDRSTRLYVSPSSTHSGNARSVTDKGAVPTMADLLDPLDRWVTTQTPPADAIVQTSKAGLPPFAAQGSRPMCRYPGYPHYMGGDKSLASSYACRDSQP
ncbi:tannase/feruloyl esterase family alpha/beta hydrolase [Variovorax sp. WS11]|uniref:tannase/feruloyl esterase family alpha/beta hydrolase n=1 Tax=Variovorax sp. WS11 TaxID=1105204 RepID=UPI0013DBA29D|nr:tannase/feruloyl esterase family alpha/beta hydrolase [Variovorax sp. WS11]NDZ18240.1 tannase/feruloyl esterase family alpha/beta hydrolase [Variovorax sp. WS11]